MAVATDLERYEAALRAQGFGRVAGADEAGRGALAGPLVAAAVIIPEGFETAGIRDSKQLTANSATGSSNGSSRAVWWPSRRRRPPSWTAGGCTGRTSRCCDEPFGRSIPSPTTR